MVLVGDRCATFRHSSKQVCVFILIVVVSGVAVPMGSVWGQYGVSIAKHTATYVKVSTSHRLPPPALPSLSRRSSKAQHQRAVQARAAQAKDTDEVCSPAAGRRRVPRKGRGQQRRPGTAAGARSSVHVRHGGVGKRHG